MERRCWKSRHYNTAEQCTIEHGTKGMAVTSRIEGSYHGSLLLVDYDITLNERWEVMTFRVDGRYDELIVAFGGKKENGRWIVNDEPLPECETCFDIDISLTPFTNTLPIKRLDLEEGVRTRIDVLYIDIFENTIGRRQQLYQKLPDDRYRFENVPKDFEATIKFDADSFVKTYPGLFRQVICR
jgi:uncharacterized protein